MWFMFSDGNVSFDKFLIGNHPIVQNTMYMVFALICVYFTVIDCVTITLGLQNIYVIFVGNNMQYILGVERVNKMIFY